ncbi:MAG: profilin family protein [Promethearchaeota archaeon]
MDEQKFNEASSELKENEAVDEVFLLDKDGNIKFKSGDFTLSDDEAKGIIKTWTQKENALMFQGSRFAILKNDDIQLAGKNIAQGKGNVVGSITKDGDYLVAHTKDEGMILEWSVLINKIAWK